MATQYDVFRFSLLAVIFIIIGSDLPDIDAKRAPISKMFQIAVPGTVVLLSLGTLGLSPPFALLLGAVSFWLYAKRMPRHRGSVHTIRAGLLFGALAAAVLYPALHDLTLCMWSRLCLAFRHFVHLLKDRWVRI